jgi:hypothetical protein
VGRRADALEDDRIRLEADSVRHGEQGMPRVVASCGAGLVACEPLAADLESAFLALTRIQPVGTALEPVGAIRMEERS